ncbi:12858_t:CDS:1 [Dentiscutata erythropus]|uniref:12858_t:CDS:1 n=1 Tax=Dentiscutata erythropus TaxID=1348616 RepID=A0A9N8VG85_9GLOM|nr:12858_t:CDS:1 [Dentiscutata erythropus]
MPDSSNDHGHEYPFDIHECNKDGFRFILRCNGYDESIMLTDMKKFAEVLSTKPREVVGFYVTPFEVPKEVKDFVQNHERTIFMSNEKEMLSKVEEQMEISKEKMREKAEKQLEEMGCKDLKIVNLKFL